MPIVYRLDKGTKLTIAELDGNFEFLDQKIDTLQGVVDNLGGSQGGGSGAQGRQGPIGPQGVAGTLGTQGRQGIPGIQGATGNGTTGAQGNNGPQGSAGTTGVQGPQGLGNSGTQGAQGRQGIGGTAGVQGFQGLANGGPQGLQGDQGTPGEVGSDIFRLPMFLTTSSSDYTIAELDGATLISVIVDNIHYDIDTEITLVGDVLTILGDIVEDTRVFIIYKRGATGAIEDLDGNNLLLVEQE